MELFIDWLLYHFSPPLNTSFRVEKSSKFQETILWTGTSLMWKFSFTWSTTEKPFEIRIRFITERFHYHIPPILHSFHLFESTILKKENNFAKLKNETDLQRIKYHLRLRKYFTIFSFSEEEKQTFQLFVKVNLTRFRINFTCFWFDEVFWCCVAVLKEQKLCDLAESGNILHHQPQFHHQEERLDISHAENSDRSQTHVCLQ